MNSLSILGTSLCLTQLAAAAEPSDLSDETSSPVVSLSTDAPLALEENIEGVEPLDTTQQHSNDGSVPVPIIIVFIFMFATLGIICIQQLHRMFTENKEFNDMKFDLPENRAVSRSGKSYGTVTHLSKFEKKKNKVTKKAKVTKTRGTTIITILDENDEKLTQSIDMNQDNSDDSIELGSGYESNASQVNQSATTNINNNNNTTVTDLNCSKGEKLRKQMKVATQGIKNKISHVSNQVSSLSKQTTNKLNKLNKLSHKGYGSVQQQENIDDIDDIDDSDENTEQSEERDGSKAIVGTPVNNASNNKNIKNVGNLYDSDDSEVRHPGYKMNYGYSEDYDCDFEDSDTQLSDEVNDKTKKQIDENETVLKRVVLECN